MALKSVDTPLAELTIRRYEKPNNLSKRELVRKLCLSFGILQPGDSRDIIVDILFVLLDAKKENKKLSSEEITADVIRFRKSEKLNLNGTAPSNVRRQLKRLRNVALVEKIKNDYRITEFSTISDIFSSKIERFMLPSIMERLKEYCNEVDKSFATVQSSK
ncbi:MAG: hypothetical protein V1859_11665 [archaeon]